MDAIVASEQMLYAPGTAQAHGHSIFREAVMTPGDSVTAKVPGSYVDVNE